MNKRINEHLLNLEIDLRKLKNIIIDENSKEKNLADLKKLIDSIVNGEKTYEESSKTILKRELTNLFNNKVETSSNPKKYKNLE
ncbi:22658_t:CDS:1, partial [Dentiscutata erythropus]